jgi:anthranilate synthase component 1
MRSGGSYCDPFSLYLQVSGTLGEGQAFLLDAARDAGPSQYRMSLIGALPLLEVQVKDGVVAVFADAELASYLRGRLEEAGFHAGGVPTADGAGTRRFLPSVIESLAWSGHADDPMVLLEALRAILRDLQGAQKVPFSSGFLGYLGYDAVHYLERLPKTTVDDRGLPDIRLQWHAVMIHLQDDTVRVFDALEGLAKVYTPDAVRALAARIDQVRALVSLYMEHPVAPRFPEAPSEPAEAVDDVSQEEFEANVERAKAYIRAGDIFQVVLSKRVRVAKRVHPYAAYDRLRRLNPSPYMFMAEYPGFRLFGASPEAQFRAVGGVAEMKPIAGTSKGRGRTPEEDEQLRRRLLEDEKERAEHVMLVDLCRNDLGRVCQVGSVRVDAFMDVEPYSHLFHLVSRVSGRLRPDVSVFHALLATFPAGTLSGAPKIRAMEIIDELERYRRGPYGGMIGVIDFDANANTAIVIRTVVEHAGVYDVQVGAGIVADSDPHQEWLECGHKAAAVMDVLGVGRPVTQGV